MLKISEIKKQDPTAGGSHSLKAVVFKVSEIEKPSSDKYKSKFYASLGDDTGSITATVYDINQRPKFVVGMGVFLMNVLVKETYIAVTSRSEVGIAKAFPIPDEIRSAPARFPGDYDDMNDMSIAKVLDSPIKSMVNVKGKVIRVSPASTKMVDGDQRPYQELMLKDKSRQHVTVAIWQDMVDKVSTGDLVKLTKCRVRLFNEDKRLTTTRSSHFETLSKGQDSNLDEVSSDDDVMDDNPGLAPKTDFTISAICDVDPYLSCPLKACNNKKLTTVKEGEKYLMQCSTCLVQYSASACNNYLRITVLLDSDGKAPPKKTAIFRPEVQKILAANGMEQVVTYDKQELYQQLMSIVGCRIKCNIINNTVKDMVTKRLL